MSSRDLSESFSRNFLTSVSFEIRFPPLLAIQNDIPKLQRELRERFPNLGKGFIFPFGQQISRAPEDIEWAFSSKDGQKQVKTTINRCVFLTTKYEGYQSFLNGVKETIGGFSEITSIKDYSRVGLRYVNQIPLPGEDSPSAEVLTYFNPVFDQKRIAMEKPFIFNSEYRTIDDDKTTRTLRNALQEREGGGHDYYIDIDTFVLSEVKQKDLYTLLERLHSRTKDEFHRNIKDSFLGVLRGEIW